MLQFVQFEIKVLIQLQCMDIVRYYFQICVDDIFFVFDCDVLYKFGIEVYIFIWWSNKEFIQKSQLVFIFVILIVDDNGIV